MRGRAIRSTGEHLSFYLTPTCHPVAAAFLERCRYHLVRNVVPTLLGMLFLGGLTLFLSAQIYGARMDRKKMVSESLQKTSSGELDLAKEILKFKI